MSKECLNSLEMSKLEDRVVEFFNGSEAAQVEEGVWYYHESSVEKELLSVYEQLAKANERVAELEAKENLTILTTHEATLNSDYGKKWLNKFAIEKKIEGFEKGYQYCKENWGDAVFRFHSGEWMSHDAIRDKGVEQLRKEQSK